MENEESSLQPTTSAAAAAAAQAEPCAICLGVFEAASRVGNPNRCKHIFCEPCIQEWSKKTNTCPVDRIEFTAIRIKQVVRVHPVLKLKYVETVPVAGKEMDDVVEMAVNCQICGLSDREETLLLCDDCDNGFHCECLRPPLLEIPDGFWFCDGCIARRERLMNPDARDPVQDVVDAIAEAAANGTAAVPRVVRRRKIVRRRRKKITKTRKGFVKRTTNKYKRLRKKPVRRKKKKVVRKKSGSAKSKAPAFPIEAPILVEMNAKKERTAADKISDINAFSFGQDKPWYMLDSIMNEVPITSEEVEKKPVKEPVKQESSSSVLLLDKILEEQSKLFGKPKLLSTFKTPEKVPTQNKTPLASSSSGSDRQFKSSEKEKEVKPSTSGLSSSKLFEREKPREKRPDRVESSSKATPSQKSESKSPHKRPDNHHQHKNHQHKSNQHSSSAPVPKQPSSSVPAPKNGSSGANVQDQIVEIAKKEIKSYYIERKINKDQYKIVMKKVVKLALRDSERYSGTALEVRVREMVHHYVKKFF